MRASQVLDAIRAEHGSKAAVVTELTIDDTWALSEHLPGRGDVLTRRIDALMFRTLQRTAIEVKVSRVDMARETWEKTLPWRKVTHRFVYAVPAGLVEHPPFYGSGLWWIHEDGKVEVRRKATINHHPEPLPQLVVQAIAYRAATGQARRLNPQLTSQGQGS